MQPQSDKRGVARRACAVVRKSSGSPGEEVGSLFQQKQTDGDDKKMYCSTSVDRTEGEVKSLATDIKSQESVSAAQHRSNQSTQQRKQWQQPRKKEEEREKERDGSKRKGPGRGKRRRKKGTLRGRDGLDRSDEEQEEEDDPDLRQSGRVQSDPDGGESDG